MAPRKPTGNLPGRPKQMEGGKNVGVYLSADVVSAIDKARGEENRSAYVRRLITWGLPRMESQPEAPESSAGRLPVTWSR